MERVWFPAFGRGLGAGLRVATGAATEDATDADGLGAGFDGLDAAGSSRRLQHSAIAQSTAGHKMRQAAEVSKDIAAGTLARKPVVIC